MRRDTHKGLETASKEMREVKTHIYMTGIGIIVRQRQQVQIKEKQEEREQLADDWREQNDCLNEAVAKEKELSDLPASKEAKAEIRILRKEIQALKKNVASMVAKMQDLNEDIEMINGGKVFVGTGNFSKKTGEEKMKAVSVFEVMPDQAVYNCTWADEQAKKQIEDIFKGMSVHSHLLERFHQDIPCLGEKLSDEILKTLTWSVRWSGVQPATSSLNVESTLQETHDTVTTEVPNLLSMMQNSVSTSDQSTATETCKNASIKEAEDMQADCIGCYQKSNVGVRCSNDHFLCTGCISMLILINTRDLEKLKKSKGALLCPKIQDGCLHFDPEYLERTLRQASYSLYEEYRTLQRKAYMLKEVLSDSEIPAHWTDMSSNKYEVQLIEVVVGSSEYNEVAQQFRKTCKQQHIVKIERIQNLEQWRLYKEKKRAMEEKHKEEECNERLLFHGTHPTAVSLINSKSFNRSYCGRNATAYGRGIYFARDASYSASDTYSPPDENGTKFMYLTKVLVGSTTIGRDDMLEPPLRPDGKGNFDSTCGLSGRDTLDNPSITVVYHDAQVYADYLIHFSC